MDIDALKLLTLVDFEELGIAKSLAEMILSQVLAPEVEEEEEIPPQFICAISFDVMRDPVAARVHTRATRLTSIRLRVF